MTHVRSRLACGSALMLCSFATGALAQAQQGASAVSFDLGTIVVTAEEQIKQALGASTISSEDLAEQPVVNDVAEIIRKMPGVNLTGSSPSGQRGNQRQVDIRGMGPENVLILIDGKPVLSRTAVKQGRNGERDTRGDTNWVPAEMVDSIEVIRGPAAARYGSGAAGGVVNIITKPPEDALLQIGTSFDIPESGKEGATQRYNLLWAKRLTDDVALRFSANHNRTDADEYDINRAEADCEVDATTGLESCTYDAGVEGVENQDYTLRLDWTPSATDQFNFELGYSRQGNIFAGDSQLGNGLTTGSDIEMLAQDGEETNVMKRGTLALTHLGSYGWGETNSFIQYEKTDNRRLAEGAAGGREGSISSIDEYDTAILEAIAAKSEADISHSIGGRAAELTLGGELRWERLDLSEYSSFSSITTDDGRIDSTGGDPITEQTTIGLYLEDNILATDSLTLTPSLRYDHSDSFGSEWSGGLNASYALTPEWTLKGGVAKAYKSPTAYQMAETYIYTTRGNGCPYPYNRNGPCYVLGNADLSPETSINKEIGLQYTGLTNGINATLTYFHNDYRDKIQSGLDQLGTTLVNGNQARLFQWDNIPDSRVQGLEGSFAMALRDDLDLAINGTYMIESSQQLNINGGTRSDGTTLPARSVEVPLSLVPDYTINASMSWKVNDQFTLIPSLTHYGKISASQSSASTGYESGNTDDRDPYTLVNLGMTYQFDSGVDLKAGVTNLFATKILRSGDGANTYNEPGRGYYLGLTKTF